MVLAPCVSVFTITTCEYVIHVTHSPLWDQLGIKVCEMADTTS